MKFSIFVSLSIMFICVFVMLSIVACRYVKLILSVDLVVFLGSVIVINRKLRLQCHCYCNLLTLPVTFCWSQL